MQAERAKVRVIGIGNPYRGDDGVGRLLARKVKPLLNGLADVREEDGEAAALMEAWEGAPAVILLDAVCSGGPPGTVHCLDVSERRLPNEFTPYSTHGFGLVEAVELARSLGKLPSRVWVVGIEGGSFGTETNLSKKVLAALARAAEEVKRLCMSIR